MRTGAALALAAVGGFAAWVLYARSQANNAPGTSALSSARANQLRAIIGSLRPELTRKERDQMKDDAVSLGANVANYASQGSVGGYWGAAGGAAVGLIKEWLD